MCRCGRALEQEPHRKRRREQRRPTPEDPVRWTFTAGRCRGWWSVEQVAQQENGSNYNPKQPANAQSRKRFAARKTYSSPQDYLTPFGESSELGDFKTRFSISQVSRCLPPLLLLACSLCSLRLLLLLLVHLRELGFQLH